MFQMRRTTCVLLSVIALTAGTVGAQDSPKDGTDRNLLERQQRETGFHVRLYDNTPPPRPSSNAPSLPLPLETSPRSTLDLGPPLPQNPNTNLSQPPQPLDPSQRRALEISQQQRLQQLQLQNKNLDEPVRQQQTQVQQLQFDRENQAQSLHDQIMRDSQGSMRQVR
jgi:hypothetical protein